MLIDLFKTCPIGVSMPSLGDIQYSFWIEQILLKRTGILVFGSLRWSMPFDSCESFFNFLVFSIIEKKVLKESHQPIPCRYWGFIFQQDHFHFLINRMQIKFKKQKYLQKKLIPNAIYRWPTTKAITNEKYFKKWFGIFFLNEKKRKSKKNL